MGGNVFPHVCEYKLCIYLDFPWPPTEDQVSCLSILNPAVITTHDDFPVVVLGAWFPKP